MSEVKTIIKIEVVSSFGEILYNKFIKKAIKKGIKRGNKLNKRKEINYNCNLTQYVKSDKSFSSSILELIGEEKEVDKDLDKINKFLTERIGYIQKTNFKYLEKIRKFGKEQVFKAYALVGIHIETTEKTYINTKEQ